MDEKTKEILDKASEIYLWLYIEAVGGFVWRMNHDLGDGRIESTPDIEKDLVTMQTNIEYAVGQLTRFGIEDPKGTSGDKYWEWYKMWKKHIEALSDEDYQKMNDLLKDNESYACPEFSPYEPEEIMFFGKKLKKLRLNKRIGLRKASEMLGLKASSLNRVESGYENPADYDCFVVDSPATEDLLSKVAEKDDNYKDFRDLLKLLQEPFVMQKMPEYGFVAHATKRIQPGEEGFTSEEDDYNTRPATAEECLEISDWLSERAKEHNKEAEAYNTEHGVA